MDSAVRVGREYVVPEQGRAAGLEAAPHKPGGVIKFQAPEIVFGPESLAEAGFAARRIGAQRPFVVTDPGTIEAGWADELNRHLADAGLPVTFWPGLTPNPKDYEIAEGYQRYRESGCDVIVAIGGGSCLDAAKGIAILTGNGGQILDYAGVDRVTRPIPPLLMIPSTAGTGADVSQFCIITDTASAVKVTIMLARWNLAVVSAMNRVRPISRLDRPRASSRSTSSCANSASAAAAKPSTWPARWAPSEPAEGADVS